MEKVRWGVIGTGKIGLTKTIPAMQRGRHCAIDAIASRELARAQAAAAPLGIPTAYGSYEALLADPAIDAVYIALPNHLHVPLSIQSLEAGKHVLCEKPIGLDAPDAERLATAAARFPRLRSWKPSCIAIIRNGLRRWRSCVGAGLAICAPFTRCSRTTTWMAPTSGTSATSVAAA